MCPFVQSRRLVTTRIPGSRLAPSSDIRRSPAANGQLCARLALCGVAGAPAAASRRATRGARSVGQHIGAKKRAVCLNTFYCLIYDKVGVYWAVELVRGRMPLKIERSLDQALELLVSGVATETPHPRAGTHIPGAELGGSRPVEHPHAAPLDPLELPRILQPSWADGDLGRTSCC